MQHYSWDFWVHARPSASDCMLLCVLQQYCLRVGFHRHPILAIDNRMFPQTTCLCYQFLESCKRTIQNHLREYNALMSIIVAAAVVNIIGCIVQSAVERQLICGVLIIQLVCLWWVKLIQWVDRYLTALISTGVLTQVIQHLVSILNSGREVQARGTSKQNTHCVL